MSNIITGVYNVRWIEHSLRIKEKEKKKMEKIINTLEKPIPTRTIITVQQGTIMLLSLLITLTSVMNIAL